MIIYTWQWNEAHQQYILKVEGCTEYEAKQISSHPAIDRDAVRFFNPHTGKLQCWLLKTFSYNIDSTNQTLEWIVEDVLAWYEPILHDWSWYLDMLVATKD